MKLITETTLVTTLMIVTMQCTQYPLKQDKKAFQYGMEDATTKIVHGIPATKTQAAMTSALHLTQLYEVEGLAGSFQCGASLITLNYLLSAAHCAEMEFCDNTKGYQVCYYHAMVANLGDYDLESQTEAENIVIEVTNIIIHPYYLKSTMKNDIALYKLANEVPLSHNVRLTCLPQYPIHLIGERVKVAGWGQTETGLYSPILLQITLTVISNKICNRVYQYKKSMDTTVTTFCTRDPYDHKGVCFGDSGSPLHYTCKEGFNVVVGVVSYGKPHCGQPRYPSVNTWVTPYVPWIMENTYNKACTRQCTRPYN